jgi:hypothetical protein
MATIDTVTGAIDVAIKEIDDQLVVIAPQHEGLRDYARLNLQDGTRREIDDAIGDYDRRVRLLTEARATYVTGRAAMVASNQALVDDGAPTLPTREITAAAVADLQAQLLTITAARGLFVVQASTLGLQKGGVEPK